MRFTGAIGTFLILTLLNLTAVAADKIAEIRMEGLGNVSSRDIEAILPFGIGDSWNESYLLSAKRTIEAYMAKRGFYHSKVLTRVDTRSSGLVYVVQIEENAPCLISSIGIPEPPGMSGVAVTRRFEKKIMSALGMRVGDRYDEELLSDRLRSVREFLSKEDFIRANTDSIRLNFDESHNRVKVDLLIDYGDRVTFGFQGNTVFSNVELAESINQLRITEFGREYVAVLARHFEELYKNLSYGNAKVRTETSQTERGRHVTFFIDEGARIQLENVKIEGLSKENLSVARQVFDKDSSRLLQRGYFVEKDLQKSIQLIIEKLRSLGFLGVKLLAQSVDFSKDHTIANVALLFVEGELTIVENAKISGFQYFDRQAVLKTLGLEEGKPFNPYKLEEGLQTLRTQYRDQGFLNADYMTPLDQIVAFLDNNRRAEINIQFHEGPRFKVGEIRWTGLSKTRDYVVSREIHVHRGDWWSSAENQIIEESLKRTGIFSDVRIKPVQSSLGPDYKDLVIELREGDPGVVEFGPGFRSDLGIRGFAQAGYSNLFGRNQTVTLSGAANRRLTSYRFPEYNLQTTFNDPRVFSSRFGFTTGLSTAKKSYIDFSINQTQFFSALERKFLENFQAKLTYKLERIHQFDAADDVDNQTLLIGSVTPSLTWDTRDSPFTATKGQVTSLSLELAEPFLAGKATTDPKGVGYYKATASTHHYLTLPFGVIWSNVLAGGYERDLFPRPNNQGFPQSPIPLIKTFRLGGYSSLRGFQEDGINQDRVAIGGSLSFINFRTQFDLPLAGELKFSPFIDVGNLFVDDRFRGSPFLRAAAGVGLHYMTPIGPINFDYGLKMNRLSNESLGQFHFSVGLI